MKPMAKKLLERLGNLEFQSAENLWKSICKIAAERIRREHSYTFNSSTSEKELIRYFSTDLHGLRKYYNDNAIKFLNTMLEDGFIEKCKKFYPSIPVEKIFDENITFEEITNLYAYRSNEMRNISKKRNRKVFIPRDGTDEKNFYAKSIVPDVDSKFKAFCKMTDGAISFLKLVLDMYGKAAGSGHSEDNHYYNTHPDEQKKYKPYIYRGKKTSENDFERY